MCCQLPHHANRKETFQTPPGLSPVLGSGSLNKLGMKPLLTTSPSVSAEVGTGDRRILWIKECLLHLLDRGTPLSAISTVFVGAGSVLLSKQPVTDQSLARSFSRLLVVAPEPRNWNALPAEFNRHP